MKKTIKIDIEVPDFLDEELVTLLSMLTLEELAALKPFLKGMLFGCGRYTLEEINVLEARFRN
ncbi:MAG: hypothetical protein HDR22_08705 [Lachnospiraceae bacterium]|nr:hypothetical protein [Lachnospiraceae bacterium]